MNCRNGQKPSVSKAKEKNLGRIQNLSQVNKMVHFYEKPHEYAKVFKISPFWKSQCTVFSSRNDAVRHKHYYFGIFSLSN